VCFLWDTVCTTCAAIYSWEIIIESVQSDRSESWQTTIKTLTIMLRGICKVNGERQNSTPPRRTPKTFTLKLGMCDYVLDIYPYAKFGCISISGGFSPNMWNITLMCLFCLLSCPGFFSQSRVQVEPLDGFSRLMAQTTRFHPRMCLLGVRIIRVKLGPRI